MSTRRRHTPPESSTSVALSSSTLMVAIVCGWMLIQLLALGNLSHARSQSLLYTEFRAQLASATAPVGPVVPAGDPVAVVKIPALRTTHVVVEGTASGDLLGGPGHLRNTVLPGQTGVSVVFGRAATYGAPFGQITRLRKGDVIEVATGQGEATMTVLGVRRSGDPMPAAPAVGAARLTLVSAEGRGPLSALSPGEAVYVDAESSTGFTAPAGRPSAVPDSEKVMGHDTSALPLMALCLGLLVALTLGVIAACHRWSTVLVWVVASPLVIALSWATTDVVMRLLPNLL